MNALQTSGTIVTSRTIERFRFLIDRRDFEMLETKWTIGTNDAQTARDEAIRFWARKKASEEILVFTSHDATLAERSVFDRKHFRVIP